MVSWAHCSYILYCTITVTGGGSSSLATVSFPGACSSSDPAILFKLDGGYTSYMISGLRYWNIHSDACLQVPPSSYAAEVLEVRQQL
jgi:hypothetical protein